MGGCNVTLSSSYGCHDSQHQFCWYFGCQIQPYATANKKYLSMRERQRLSVSNTVEKLDMNAKISRRMVFCAEAKRIKATVEKLDKKRKEPQDKVVKAAGKASYQTMVSDSDYTEFDNFSKLLTCLLSTISMECLNSLSCIFVQITHGSYENEPVVINGKKITVTDIFPLLVSATLKHQNLVRFIAVCRKPMVWCIVTEYAKGGSVRQFFATRQSQAVPLKLALTQTLDVARGMEYLQSLGFVHRDPMPRQPADNVFYRSANVLDSASLGSERKFYTEHFNNSYVVVLWENVDNKQTTVSNAYVYGFGVIVLEVVCGRMVTDLHVTHFGYFGAPTISPADDYVMVMCENVMVLCQNVTVLSGKHSILEGILGPEIVGGMTMTYISVFEDNIVNFEDVRPLDFIESDIIWRRSIRCVLNKIWRN
ncbi:hypothetical protein SUGI_1181590 [Cryptomeria japonica]|nr:hypothetical protein SUGI_1181590 [Cryptomeria japonica]